MEANDAVFVLLTLFSLFSYFICLIFFNDTSFHTPIAIIWSTYVTTSFFFYEPLKSRRSLRTHTMCCIKSSFQMEEKTEIDREDEPATLFFWRKPATLYCGKLKKTIEFLPFNDSTEHTLIFFYYFNFNVSRNRIVDSWLC